MDRQKMIVLGATAVGVFLAYRYGNDMVKGVATVLGALVIAKQVPVLNAAAA